MQLRCVSGWNCSPYTVPAAIGTDGSKGKFDLNEHSAETALGEQWEATVFEASSPRSRATVHERICHSTLPRICLTPQITGVQKTEQSGAFWRSSNFALLGDFLCDLIQEVLNNL
jgi:hypothetical protein